MFCPASIAATHFPGLCDAFMLSSVFGCYGLRVESHKMQMATRSKGISGKAGISGRIHMRFGGSHIFPDDLGLC